MEGEGEKSIIESLDGEGKCVEKLLVQFNLLELSSVLNSANFREICAAIFCADEIKDNEQKVQEIFDLFDRDGDGVLNGRERNIFYDWLRKIIEPVNVLLIVDVQNDFIDGSLALRERAGGQDGVDVVKPLNRLIREGRFDKVIYSLDWHPENHISFYENLHLRELHPDSKVKKGDAKPFDTVLFDKPRLEQKLWPKHCVMDTWGAELYKDLVIAPDSIQVRKGQNPEREAYSVFLDSSAESSSELETILQEVGVTNLYICGLAYDICVNATCLDGLRLGYSVVVVDDCCRGVSEEDVKTVKKLISENSGLIADSDHVLSMVNEKKRSLILSYQSAKTLTSISNP